MTAEAEGFLAFVGEVAQGEAELAETVVFSKAGFATEVVLDMKWICSVVVGSVLLL